MTRPLGNLQAEFLTATSRFADLMYGAVTHAPFVKDDVPHTFFVANYKGTWMDCGRAEWKCVGMTLVKQPVEKMLALSEDGDVYTYVGGQTATESIRPAPAALRGVTTVEGRAFAFGMRRQAYERADEGRWSALHAPDLAEGEVGGFEAVCAFSRQEIYAVGWRGEIWRFDGSAWHRCDSPVNVILTGATVHSDGNVYVCGQNGTLLKGRADVWKVIAEEETVDDLWAIASFQEQIYVASFSRLCRLDGDQLVEVDLNDALARTFHTLTHAGGVLWSVGADDVLFFDGRTWSRAL